MENKKPSKTLAKNFRNKLWCEYSRSIVINGKGFRFEDYCQAVIEHNKYINGLK